MHIIIGLTGPGEPPEDGEMNEMTLPSRHRIRNASPGGLRPSRLHLRTIVISEQLRSTIRGFVSN